MSDADLMAAITAGIEEGSSLPAAVTHNEPVEETTDDETVTTEGEGEGTEPETTEVEAEAQTDDKGQPVRDEKGRFIKKQPDAETPEAKTARETAEAAALAEKNKGKTPEQIEAAKKAVADIAAAKKDPVNAPIPKDLKVETADRMRSLVKIAKEQTAAATQATENLGVIMKGITDSRCTPEQYGTTMNIIALINSGDRAKQEQALTMLHTEYSTLAKILGKPVAGVDMLADHADLRAEIQAGKLTQERAQEIAALRESGKIRTDMQARSSAATAEQTAAATEERDAKTALTAFEGIVAATDPQWTEKKAFLVKSLRNTFAAIPPKLWKNTFEAAYHALPKDFGKKPLPAGSKAAVPGSRTPLRAINPAGGQATGPKDMLEAVTAGIAQASQR